MRTLMIFTIIGLVLTSVILMSVLGTTVYAANDCTEAISIIEAEYLRIITYRDMSWYGAGLIYGLHYVKEDCHSASEKMGEILDDIWIAEKEYKFDRHILDKVASAIRFVDKTLN